MKICSVCAKNFKNQSSLNTHYSKFHKNVLMRCDCCKNRKFYNKKDLRRHLIDNLKCVFCNKQFIHKSSLSRHKKVCNKKLESKLIYINSKTIKCEACECWVEKRHLFNHQRSDSHRDKIAKAVNESLDLYQEALNGMMKIYRYKNKNEDNVDPKLLLREAKSEICSIIRKEILLMNTLKFRLIHTGYYVQPAHLNAEEEKGSHTQLLQSIKSFSSNYYDCNQSTNLEEEIYDLCVSQLLKRLHAFEEQNSGKILFAIQFRLKNFSFFQGWTLLNQIQVVVEILKTEILGHCYICLPKSLEKSKNVLNIFNDNQECLIYCVLAHLYRHELDPTIDDLQNFESYEKFKNNLILTNLEFPLTLQEIDKFCLLNAHFELSINIYDFNEKSKSFGVVKICAEQKRNHCNLLLLVKNTKSCIRSHFALILDLASLVRNFITKNRSSNFFLCNKCLSHFTRQEKYDFHSFIGCQNTAYAVKSFPYLTFNKQYAKSIGLFFAACDFECLIKPLNNNCSTKTAESSFTLKRSKHEPIAAAYKIHTFNDDPLLSETRVFIGRNCVHFFFEQIIADVCYFYDEYLSDDIEMSEIDTKINEKLTQTEICYICERKLNLYDDVCIDHYHVRHTNLFDTQLQPPVIAPYSNIINKVHKLCNLQRDLKLNFIFFLHHLSGYDAMLIMNYLLHNDEYKDKVSVIAKNKNSFLAIKLKYRYKKKIFNICFYDSYLHLQKSLASLAKDCVNYLDETNKFFKEKLFPNEHFNVDILNKIPFPYDFIRNVEILQYVNFPSRESFFNVLTNQSIDEEDYQLGMQIFKNLKCENLEQYLNAYITVDILLLFDILKSYQKLIYSHFRIDALAFMTAPSLSYNLWLFEVQDQKIEIMRDPSMIHLFAANVKAGYCCGNSKILTANNDYMESGYISSKGNYSYLFSYDINAMYTTVMIESAYAVGNFQWIFDEPTLESLKNNILNYTENDKIGYYLICSIEYPKKLHDAHADAPILVDKCIFKKNKTKKLLATLFDKDIYCGSILLIQYAVRRGLVLKNIIAAISYAQNKIFASYLSKVHEIRRKNINNSFLNTLLKIIGNAIYGKQLERLDLRRIVYFLTEFNNFDRRKQCAKKIFSNPRLIDADIIDDNLVCVQLKLSRCVLDRNLINGNIILDNSKVKLAFFIEKLKEIYTSAGALKCNNVFNDTDSVLLYVEFTDNKSPFRILANYPEIIDLASFQGIDGLPLTGSKEINKIGSDVGRKICYVFVYLKPKNYYVGLWDNDNKVKSKKIRMKGIQKLSALKFDLKDYEDIITQNDSIRMAKIIKIHREKLQLFTIEMNKVALTSTECTKRIWNGNESLPYGHFSLNQTINECPFTIHNAFLYDENKFNLFKNKYFQFETL